jgi:carbonic anhydrase
MKGIEDLVAGFRRFQSAYYGERRELVERLVRQGQTPKVMVVACCDSRVDPAIVTDCDPGDLFVVRNVANLVPPCEEGGGYHGTSAALEFAVGCLRVEHVIVMGHARCGGIRALLGDLRFSGDLGRFITPWMSIAAEARLEALTAAGGDDNEARARACEQAAIRVSLRNLTSFPFIRDAVASGGMQLHGWYFNLERGELDGVDPTSGAFVRLVDAADRVRAVSGHTCSDTGGSKPSVGT